MNKRLRKKRRVAEFHKFVDMSRKSCGVLVISDGELTALSASYVTITLNTPSLLGANDSVALDIDVTLRGVTSAKTIVM